MYHSTIQIWPEHALTVGTRTIPYPDHQLLANCANQSRWISEKGGGSCLPQNLGVDLQHRAQTFTPDKQILFVLSPFSKLILLPAFFVVSSISPSASNFTNLILDNDERSSSRSDWRLLSFLALAAGRWWRRLCDMLQLSSNASFGRHHKGSNPNQGHGGEDLSLAPGSLPEISLFSSKPVFHSSSFVTFASSTRQ